MNTRSLGAVGLLALGLGGCADLNQIESGECGNGIVEASSGEECDTFPEGSCAAPGTANECRHLCTPASSSGGEQLDCPAGFGCGTDGVCRSASGEFVSAGALRQGYTLRVEKGDFNGDGQEEVVSITPSALGVHYLDSRGAQTSVIEVNGNALVPAIGNLTGDTLHDLVVLRSELGGGLNVLRGRSDSTLQPTAYSPFEVGNSEAEVVVMEAMETGSVEDVLTLGSDEILVLGDGAIFSAGAAVDLVVNLPDDISELAGKPLVGQLDIDPIRSPCEELALAFRGASSVWVYTPCHRQGTAMRWNSTESGTPLRSLPPVQLPSGRRISSGARLADLNADGLLDLMIGVEPDGSTCFMDDLYISFGVGDGTFHSDAATIPTENGDGQTRLLDNDSLCELPLAIGDLNGDGVVDVVTQREILISDLKLPGLPGQARYNVAAFAFDSSWSSAVIADFNANGVLDVVVTAIGSNTIAFFNGVGDGRLNRFDVQARGEPTELTVGDYDGDLVLDLAFKELGPHGNVGAGVEAGDSLSIAFGNAFGGLSAPLSMGRLARIDRISAGNISTGVPDGITDLLVLSTAETSDVKSIALLTGVSDRQLVSPFFFDSAGSAVPVRAVIGEFTGDDHADIVVMGASGDVFEFGAAENRVWVLPTTGEAAIDQSTVIASETITANMSMANALYAPIDLNADGIDELVALGSLETSGVVLSGRLQEGQFQLNEPSLTEEAYFFDPYGIIASVPTSDYDGGGEPGSGGRDNYVVYNGQVATHDVDGDGHQDLLALGLVPGSETEVPEPHLVLFRNPGEGGLDVSGRILLKNPPGLTPSTFVVVNADTDPEAEVVLLGPSGAFILDLDIPGGQLVDPKPIANVRSGHSIVSGDFNGDGVPDLAVASEFGAQVLLGKAVIE